jgi:uncharacterized protein YecE (DUF72 family)
MGIRTLYGSAGARGAIDAFARRFDVLELDILDREPKPKDATLKKWRKEAGPTLNIALVAPKALSAVRPGPALDEALARLLEAQRLLQARFLVVQTTTEVTPSQLNRERLAKVIERIRDGLGEARDLVRIAWEPRGLWEPEDAASLAKKLGVDLAMDPLADPREPFFHDVLRYWRLGTVGGRTEFPPARLRYLAEVIAAQEGDGERVVVFATPHAPREAKRLRTLADSLAERAPKGGGAIIRPRGSFALPDEDE